MAATIACTNLPALAWMPGLPKKKVWNLTRNLAKDSAFSRSPTTWSLGSGSLGVVSLSPCLLVSVSPCLLVSLSPCLSLPLSLVANLSYRRCECMTRMHLNVCSSSSCLLLPNAMLRFILARWQIHQNGAPLDIEVHWGHCCWRHRDRKANKI